LITNSGVIATVEESRNTPALDISQRREAATHHTPESRKNKARALEINRALGEQQWQVSPK
jgi:hypothetical protein